MITKRDSLSDVLFPHAEGVRPLLVFGLLGPVEARVSGSPLPVGGRRAQAVLATLLLQGNQVVTIDRVVDGAWGDDAPDTARVQAQNRISALRGALRGAGIDDVIETRGAGYLVTVTPDNLDAEHFAELVRRAQEHLRDDDLAGAASTLRTGLGLWRGPALDGLATPLLHAAAQRLEEARLVAREELIGVQLQLGQPEAVIGELLELVAEHPWRERLTGQLMTALHRTDRQREALEQFEHLRRRLGEELGLDPGVELMRLRDDILRSPSGPVPAGAAVAPVSAGPGDGAAGGGPRGPRQLPAASSTLVGRDEEIARAIAALVDPVPHRPAPAIVAIHGPGGVGKSALAVAVGHAVAEHFPDGQLYVDLQGSTPGLAPLNAADVLGRFLRALAVAPAAVPAGVGEAGTLLRTVLADRRVLIVADNAGGVEQVVSLLPASAMCAVIVTSRPVLGMLDGAVRIGLGPLTPHAAAQMLTSMVDTTADPSTVADVAQACGYLPLALRIAAARLVSRPDWTFAELASRLRDERRTLHELHTSDDTLRANLRLSWHELRADQDPVDALAAAVFLRLGALRVPAVDPGVVAAITTTTPALARFALDRLVDVGLLGADSARYRMHDLVRLLAAELASGHPASDGRQTLGGALRWYAGMARRAGTLMRGPAQSGTDELGGPATLANPTEAAAWLDAERANLVAVVRQAVAEPPTLARLGGELVLALYPALLMRGHHYEWEVLCRTVLDAAERVGDAALIATTWTKLAVLYSIQLRREEALECLSQALPIQRGLGDRDGEASTLETTAMVHARRNDAAVALPLYEAALAIRRELGSPFAEAITLSNAAEAYLRLDRPVDSLRCLTESLAIRREYGDVAGEAITLLNLGEVLLAQNDLAGAAEHADLALARSRAAAERENERRSLCLRARIHAMSGDVPAAHADCESIVDLSRAVGASIDPSDLVDLVAALERAGERTFAADFSHRVRHVPAA